MSTGWLLLLQYQLIQLVGSSSRSERPHAKLKSRLHSVLLQGYAAAGLYVNSVHHGTSFADESDADQGSHSFIASCLSGQPVLTTYSSDNCVNCTGIKFKFGCRWPFETSEIQTRSVTLRSELQSTASPDSTFPRFNRMKTQLRIL